MASVFVKGPLAQDSLADPAGGSSLNESDEVHDRAHSPARREELQDEDRSHDDITIHSAAEEARESASESERASPAAV